MRRCAPCAVEKMSSVRSSTSVFEPLARHSLPRVWSPRTRQSSLLMERLAAAKVPSVANLFDVMQGALTGNNKAFIISTDEYAALLEPQREYFRPALGSSTIEQGRTLLAEYVFYPYGPKGLLVKTEAELKKLMSGIFATKLWQFKPALAARSRVDGQWWKLAEERAWLRTAAPKLVSAYFGDSGSFAYDDEGEFVVLQGYGWLWRSSDPVGRMEVPSDVAGETAEVVDVAFHDSLLPWAYLALLNSGPFECVLECVCPRVQGGQFNLSKRFVDKALLPDLSDESRVRSDILRELANLGRMIHAGKGVDNVRADLNRLCILAYGCPASYWPSRIR